MKKQRAFMCYVREFYERERHYFVDEILLNKVIDKVYEKWLYKPSKSVREFEQLLFETYIEIVNNNEIDDFDHSLDYIFGRYSIPDTKANSQFNK